jgi:two-component system, NarL family, sensor kinase
MGNRSNQKAASLFLLLIAVVLFGTWISYRATTRIANSEHWVTHTYVVLGALDELSGNLQQAESNANDYAATGKQDYLNRYRASAEEIDEDIANIARLTTDNRDQQTAIAQVQIKAAQLKEYLDNVVDYRAHGSFSQPTGEQLQDVVQDVAAMGNRESELLKQRTHEAAVSLQTTRVGVVAGAAINCILLGFGSFLIIRDQAHRWQVKDSKLRLASIVDSSDDAILSKKLDGTVTSWNSGAERLYGWMAEEMIGRSIYEIVPPERREELRDILERLGRGQRVEHLETFRIRRDSTPVEVELTVSPVRDEHGAVVEASAIARDITHRKQLERSLHQLSIKILQAQDEERRRIARELHDTTVQKLALMSMNLAQLKNSVTSDKGQATLQNSQTLATECVQELRTLSYVLHPPMLDELGLASALKIYVEGLAQRSGVKIETDIDPAWQRLAPVIEMALFRISQEGLSNVLRHSGSKMARIQLSNGDDIVMKISDEGKGLPTTADVFAGEVTVGVGIPGMNERIRQLGGSLTIDSGPNGTTVTARIPSDKAAHA